MAPTSKYNLSEDASDKIFRLYLDVCVLKFELIPVQLTRFEKCDKYVGRLSCTQPTKES
jgi:hypothetical protein